MASTKLRDIRYDYQKSVNAVASEQPVVTPPAPPLPTEVSPQSNTSRHIDFSTAGRDHPVPPAFPEAKKNNYAMPVAVFCGIVTLGTMGLYFFNQQKNENAYYADAHEVNSAAVSSAEQAAADAVAAADAAVATEILDDTSQEELHSESVDTPLLTYGSNWTYKIVDYVKPENSYDNVRLSVSDVHPDGYTMYKEWIGTNRESAVLEYDDALNLKGGAIATYSPALAYYDFPLYPGKTWHKGSDVVNHKYASSDHMTFDGKVVGWETISSPEWSDIKALRVEVEIVTYKEGEEIARDLDVSWYEPEVGRAIKTLDYKWNDSTQSYGEPTRLHYVVNYNRR